MMIRRLAAELLGTFALVFFGCGAIATLPGNDRASFLAINLVFGFVIVVMVSAVGPISAAHFNPAVTLGFAVAKRFPWSKVPGYWAAQVLGAVLASLAHLFILGSSAKAVSFGATATHLPLGPSLAVEAIGTFFLMFVIAGVATDKRVHAHVPALAIGLTVTLVGLFAGPLTGSCLNPARSLGPALLAGGPPLLSIWLYIFGPLLGATLGSLTYELIRLDKEHAQSAPHDLS